MFESAACDHLHLIDTPFVHGQTLIELKTVLQTALHAGVLQTQPHSLPAGGADATVQMPTASLATDPVSSAIAPPVLPAAAVGHPGKNDSSAGPTAPPARRSDASRW
jgi:hypothetical protein